MQPDAKLYFHQTWAYETDSNHAHFANYNENQKEMYNCIKNASRMATEKIGTKMIPTGEVIQTLRETIAEFDYASGGISLCRDGFHLSFDYGRFAAAATWFHIITGKKIGIANFDDFNSELINKIIKVINQL